MSIDDQPKKQNIEYKTWDSRPKMKTTHYKPSTKIIKLEGINNNVYRNIKIEFFDQDQLSKDDKMFQFWIHASFLDPFETVFRLTKSEIDEAVKDKAHKLF